MTFWSHSRPLFIGIAGGSGSGKTTTTRAVLDSLPTVSVASIQHDSYYRNRSDLSFEERSQLNYDHPDSLETKLLVEHIKRLAAGKSVEVPGCIYPYLLFSGCDMGRSGKMGALFSGPEAGGQGCKKESKKQKGQAGLQRIGFVQAALLSWPIPASQA